MLMNDVYDDCPESTPRVQSTLPGKGAATRRMRSSLEYQNVRKQYRSRAKAHAEAASVPGGR